MTIPLLTILGLLPLIGGLLAFLFAGRSGKIVAFVFSLLVAVVGLLAFFMAGDTDLGELHSWIPAIGAHYALGLDGMGRTMVLLTVVLVPIVLLSQWNIADRGSREPRAEDIYVQHPRWSSNIFGGLVLIMESFALFVFLADDVLLFYIFFEATLLPMYFLIVGWGSDKASKAAMKFLIYSLAGGLVMLFGIVGVFAVTSAQGSPSFLIADFTLEPTGALGKWIFVAFFIAFAIKAPMVPVHTWLPDTAEQSNPGATALLVGVLDKIGTFGMIKLCLTMFPEASKWAAPVILVLAVISILYGAVLAIASSNLLRLVAYTSVSHFGFMVLGIFAFTTTSLNGSMFYMLGHGVSSALLFLVVDMMIKRRGCAEIRAFGGVQKVAPLIAGVFLLGGLATMGLPGTMNFVGEYSIMVGAFTRHPVLVAFAVLGTVLAAVYVLWAYQRVFTGEPTPSVTKWVRTDLTVLERVTLAPLIALLLVFGFFPKPFTQLVQPVAENSMTSVQLADPLDGANTGSVDGPRGGK